MSKPDFLEKLLNGAGVAWLPLGDVLVRTKGTKITAGQMRRLHRDGAPLKVFAGGRTVAYVNFADIPAKDINRKPSIIVKSRGIIEFEYYDEPFSHKNEMWSYHSNDDSIKIKYVYHFLKLNEPYFRGIGSRMQMPQIATPDTDKFPIPIPCPDDSKKSLAIQGEIVRILDTLTALTTELTAALTTELTARKKQYHYYRDHLLSFDKTAKNKAGKPDFLEKLLDGAGVAWLPLGDVLVRSKGTKITAGQMRRLHRDGAPLKVFAGGRTVAYVNFADVPAKDINRKPSIIVKSRGIIEFEYYDEPFSHKNEMWSYHSNDDSIKIKYVYHFLKLNEPYFRGIGSRMQMPQIATPDTDKFPVPIPCPDDPKKSLAIQGEIVRILDTFDTLTHSISEGLPHEIKLRQKQYAYYRDMLLNFPRLGEQAAA